MALKRFKQILGGMCMPLDIVRGRVGNISATNELIEVLKKRNSKYAEILYLGYPLAANVEGMFIVDALLISEEKGIVAFVFTKYDDKEQVIEEQGKIHFQLLNTLTQYPSLRKGLSLAFVPNVISITTHKFDDIEDSYKVTGCKDLLKILSELPMFDAHYYRLVIEAMQKISSIKPRKKRDNIKKSLSKGNVIKKIEKEIANLDSWQQKTALEIADGPQRVRGLAGSGKTIVLALKAAYLHAQNPEWDIVVTYYTRALWQQYRNLITKFMFEFSRDEPNWEKLHLFHAWGSQSEDGLYSEIMRSIGQVPINFVNARMKYGRDESFSGICNELNAILPDNYTPVYDVLLIDEAQDMPVSFFRMAYKCVKPPKRIIWAYDELQNLGSSAMPSVEEMFGTDKNGNALVQLKNKENAPMQDITLPICYRNPPWVLALAHSLGFGIYRKELIQHFDTLELWEEIGYQKDRGELAFGKEVELSRKKEATPSYFYELLKPEDVIIAKSFASMDIQFDYVAKQIKTNIDDDELDPDDILVVFPSAMYANKQYQRFAQHLSHYNVDSMLVGVTNGRDIFHVSGEVSCATIYRAKGNEAPMVYIVNAEECYGGLELIKLRNILFTAITRSRAWVRILGVGSSMEKLIEEINRFINKNYVLDFKIPTRDELNKLRRINRERSINDTKKIEEAKKGVRTIVELISKGDLDASQIPEFDSLVKMIINNSGGEYIDEEN